MLSMNSCVTIQRSCVVVFSIIGGGIGCIFILNDNSYFFYLQALTGRVQVIICANKLCTVTKFDWIN